VSSARCERTRLWAALIPDGELSLLERRLLEAHLGHCATCRGFAERVAEIAADLREAAAERPSRRLLLPAAPIRRSAHVRVRSVASLAAVAAMAVGIAAQAPVPIERQRPPAPVGAAPAEVEDAEQRTMRFLRRDAQLASPKYADRPAHAFGTRPA
jgi:Putative zinc-finger